MMPQWPLGAAYTITGAIAMQTIASYLHSQPTKQWQFSLILGALELVFSQVRWGHRLPAGCHHPGRESPEHGCSALGGVVQPQR